MSWLEYGDLRDRPRAFGDVIAFRMTPLYIGRRGEVERAYGLLVSGNYFEDLGLRPALGRFIDAGGVVPARMFAVLGPMLLVLAAIGIYAVVAYNISQRTVETGVRLALGATRARVIAGLVFESMTVVTLGVMAGWLIAFVAAPAILGGRIDTAVFLGVPAILLAVGAVSCWLPARRARPARSHDRAPRRVTP